MQNMIKNYAKNAKQICKKCAKNMHNMQKICKIMHTVAHQAPRAESERT